VEEALKAGFVPAFLFSTDVAARGERARTLLEEGRSRGTKVRTASEAVLSAMADTVHPSGILAVMPMPEQAHSPTTTLAVIIDQLRDPGNMGTILRSALAAGVDLLLTTAQTVDVFSPKVVRAAMGAHFHLPMILNQPWTAIQEATRGMHVVLADPGVAGQNYWALDWRLPTALIIGSEAEGASNEAQALATTRVIIPMRGDVESLNAGVAASIVLFEAARQRTGQG
jgi:RNA methyltransferase, TrmH family